MLKDRFSAIRDLFEFMEYRWYKYIVNYDLQTQFGLAKSVWNSTVGQPSEGGEKESTLISTFHGGISKKPS